MGVVSSGAHVAPRYPELDVVRGLAVIFMVVNHAGVRLLTTADATQGWLGALVFFGSFAPALFFFATGVGSGLAGEQRRTSTFWPMADKVLLLLLADAFLSLQSGSPRWWFDFFSFIGLCVFAVWLLQRARHPVLVALVTIVVLLVLRYVVGPWVYAQGWTRGSTWTAGVLAWMLGTPGVHGFSYLASPWLVYPLAGYAVGVWYREASGLARACALWLVLSMTALALAASGGAYVTDKSFFRWGTVAVAFFVLSIAVVALVCLASLALVRKLPALSRLLALTGVSAFAAVPVHYALLAWAKPALGLVSPLAFCVVTLVLLILTLLISRGVEQAVQRLRATGDRPAAASAAFGLTLIAGAATVTLVPQFHALVGCVAQLMMVALFASRYRLSHFLRIAP